METLQNLLSDYTAELASTNENRERSTRENNMTAKHARDVQKEFEQLISSLPTMIIGLSRDNDIALWNAKAEDILGTGAESVIGLHISQCGIEWDWDKILDGIIHSRYHNVPTRVDDIQFLRPDGEKRYLGITVNPLNGDENSVLGLTIIGADITDRKKMESQLQQSHKMEAIGQLAAGIAHEINTPVQFVGDNTRFFQEAFDDLIQIIKKQQETLEAVKSNSLTDELIEKTEQLIEEMDLEYLEGEIPVAVQHTLKGVERIAKIVQAMKIFAHPGMVAKEPVDINKEIGKTITITRNEWKYVAELKTDFDQSLPLVPCFRAEFNQVILNMIVNAAHAIAEKNQDNPSQKGTIHIRTIQEGGQAKICIGDSGAGIPEEIRHKIFDLFFTTKEAGKGTGQGLAISHSVIVEKHKGSLTMETQEGKGTTFIIGLPMEADPADNESNC
ncbi:MAG: ATP-binding protein [Desulfobacterales bacterium]